MPDHHRCEPDGWTPEETARLERESRWILRWVLAPAVAVVLGCIVLVIGIQVQIAHAHHQVQR